jgi:D-alanyl-D-alanine carboxypeptidase
MKNISFIKIGIYVICSLLLFPLFSCSKKTVEVSNSAKLTTQNSINEISTPGDEQKLVTMLTNSPLPFTNVKGEAADMAQNILSNKKAFLSDLHIVLSADVDDLLIKADKQTSLSADYKPTDLVHLGTEKQYWIYRNDLNLRVPVEASLAIMAEDASAQGIKLVISSSYRSYKYQSSVYNRIVAELGQVAADRESARPGTSQHQLGTVVDFGSITDDYADTKAGKWLFANAASYGWSLSFPKEYEDVTGYRWECWHYRYVGIPAVKFQQKWFNNVQQYMIEFIYNWRNM